MRVIIENREKFTARRRPARQGRLRCVWTTVREGDRTILQSRWIEESAEVYQPSEGELAATPDDPLPAKLAA
jgi:hypothetical protein